MRWHKEKKRFFSQTDRRPCVLPLNDLSNLADKEEERVVRVLHIGGWAQGCIVVNSKKNK